MFNDERFYIVALWRPKELLRIKLGGFKSSQGKFPENIFLIDLELNISN